VVTQVTPVKGRTINKMLAPRQLETCRPWIANGRRLHGLANQAEPSPWLHAYR